MKIKKYKAPSLKSGKDKILEELGDNAVILSSRTVKSENPNQPDYIEIVAAADDDPIQSEPTNGLSHDSLTLQEALKSKDQERDVLLTLQKIQDEIKDLKSIVSTISDNVKYKYSSNLSDGLERLFKYLIHQGFSESTVLKIIGQISTAGLADNIQKAIERSKELFTRNLQILKPMMKEKNRQIVFFMGPTGSGKTSTLVKLSIIGKLVHKTDCMIISTDTDKVGGADQLQSFASIAGIPYETAYTSRELKELLAKEELRDFIFIDTTGKSQNNEEHFKELKTIQDASKPNLSYLVISCTTNSDTLSNILEKYEKMRPTGIILTKFDELVTIGQLLDTLKDSKYPLAYFTKGQKIPEDIEPAGKEFLRNFAFRNFEL